MTNNASLKASFGDCPLVVFYRPKLINELIFFCLVYRSHLWSAD